MSEGALIRSWRQSGWLGLLAAGLWLALGLAAPASAAPDPCAAIRAACRAAGFAQGAGAAGVGLMQDCFTPIVRGQAQPRRATRPLPRVAPRAVSACRAASGLSGVATPPTPATPQPALRIRGPTPVVAPRPSGLVAVLTYQSGQTLSLNAFDNRYISGVALQIHWSDIEPTAGDPQWATLDAVFARAKATGKWVQLFIFPGFFAPTWAYPASDSAVFPLQYGPGHKKGEALPLPMPWDATYQANWLAFMQLVAARYGANPAFAIMGAAGPTSVSDETTEPNTAADQTTWKSMGYTQTKYVGAWSAVLPSLAADFPGQYLSIEGGAGTNSIVDIDASGAIVKNANLGTKQQIVDAATTAVGARLGLQNSNLDGSTGGDEPNTNYVISYAGKVLTGFQLRTSASGTGMGGGTPAQVLKAAFDNGIRANPAGDHVDYIEVYDKDVEDPTLQTTLAYGASLFAPPSPAPPPPPSPPPGYPHKPCGTHCM